MLFLALLLGIGSCCPKPKCNVQVCCHGQGVEAQYYCCGYGSCYAYNQHQKDHRGRRRGDDVSNRRLRVTIEDPNRVLIEDFEESDVLRTFLHANGYTDNLGAFVANPTTSWNSVTAVCDEIMDHVSGTHKHSIMHYLLSSERETDVMDSVGAETVGWVAEKVPARRRLAEEQQWNITRRLQSDTWEQSLGYVVAGQALIAEDRVDSGAQALLASYGSAAERRTGCARFVDLVNDEVQTTKPEGIEYHPEDEVVSITEEFATSLGIKQLLPAVTLASGQIVLALFNSCRRYASTFGGATCKNYVA